VKNGVRNLKGLDWLVVLDNFFTTSPAWKLMMVGWSNVPERIILIIYPACVQRNTMEIITLK